MAQKLERNEELFRKANERLKSRLGDLAWLDHIPFVCECADGECLDAVEVTMAEYERVRSSGRAYLLAPGHDARLEGEVVERTERYVVVTTT